MFIFILIFTLTAIILTISYATYRIGFYISSEEKIRLNPFSKTSEKSTSQKKSQASSHDGFPDFSDKINYILQLPYEPVSITSHDGLHLTGKYYHMQDGAPLQIQMQRNYKTSGKGNAYVKYQQTAKEKYPSCLFYIFN